MSPKRKKYLKIIGLSILAIVLAILIALFLKNFPTLKLDTMELKNILGILGSLFFIIIIVERAIEFLLPDKNKETKHQLKRNLNLWYAKNINVQESEESFRDSKELRALIKNRRRKTQLLGFVLGLVLGFLGFRVLSSIIIEPVNDVQLVLIGIVDIFLTATLIAGGSQGFHEISKLLRDYFSATNRQEFPQVA